MFIKGRLGCGLWVRILFSILLVAVSSAGANNSALDSEAAFRFSARLNNNNELNLHYLIADGYYLYKDQFQLTVIPTTIQVSQLIFHSTPEKHNDDFFGESLIFRKEVSISAQLERFSNTGNIQVKMVSQGCSDSGVCYLPTEAVVDFYVVKSDE